ncbi:MAG: LysM peptidoglycan-binding domain-containing protein [Candidatus Syntrophonatronum acetioxidans]|uniref:LysM peptidoglycan-binding domain-containing protein n=1 Tax=Candidatus Syntrophonatronum acetioxidans TaxID=1795816 RepID=A0A424YBX8_9FIRM|nr:MAG: LysM peptidoglycan-binding domain-containing protein [Candidatus Syntrophonatronum acetioxidans]
MAGSTDLITSVLDIKQLVAENAVQFSMVKEISIPGEIKKIERVETEITGLIGEIAEDEARVEGTLILRGFYLTGEGKEEETEMEEDFFQLIPLPGIEHGGKGGDLNLKVYPRVELTEMDKLVCEEGRSIFAAAAVIEIFALCYREINLEVVSEIPGGDPGKAIKEKLFWENFIAMEGEVVSLPSQIDLNKPAARIQGVNSKLEDVTWDIEQDMVRIEGYLINQISYIQESSGETRDESSKERFSHSLKVPGAQEGMKVKGYPRVEGIKHKIDPRERTRVEQEVRINLFALVKEDIITEVICQEEEIPLSLPGERLLLYQPVRELSEELSFSTEVELEVPVKKIAWPGELGFHSIEGDMEENYLKIKGSLDSKIIYVDELTGGIGEENFAENFSHKFDVPEKDEGMILFIYPRLEMVDYEIMEDGKRVKQNAAVRLNVKIVDIEEQWVCVKGEEKVVESKGEEAAGGTVIVVYVMQEEDSIFNVAQRFNVSIDAIMRANKIEDPDLIYPGQKILVPGNTDARW